MPLYNARRIHLGKVVGHAEFEAQDDDHAYLDANEGIDWKTDWVEITPASPYREPSTITPEQLKPKENRYE